MEAVIKFIADCQARCASPSDWEAASKYEKVSMFPIGRGLPVFLVQNANDQSCHEVVKPGRSFWVFFFKEAMEHYLSTSILAAFVTFLKDTTSDLVQKNIVTGLECLLILQELRPFYHEQISLQLKALLSKKNDTNVSSQPGETSVDPSKLLTELDCLEVQLAASLSLAEPDPSTFSSLQETRAFLDRVDFVCFRFACARTISTHQDQEAVSAMYPDRGSREVFMVAKLCFSGAKFLANLGYMEEAYNYVIRGALCVQSRYDGLQKLLTREVLALRSILAVYRASIQEDTSMQHMFSKNSKVRAFCHSYKAYCSEPTLEARAALRKTVTDGSATFKDLGCEMVVGKMIGSTNLWRLQLKHLATIYNSVSAQQVLQALNAQSMDELQASIELMRKENHINADLLNDGFVLFSHARQKRTLVDVEEWLSTVASFEALKSFFLKQERKKASAAF